MIRSLRAAMASGLIGCQACYTWNVQPVEPRTFETGKPADQFRVRLQNGDSYVIEAATLRGDTLKAIGVKPRGPFQSGLAEVAEVAVRKFDSGQTVGTTLILVAGAVTAVLVFMTAGSPDL